VIRVYEPVVGPAGAFECRNLDSLQRRTFCGPVLIVQRVALAILQKVLGHRKASIAAALHVAFVDRLWIAVMLLWWLKPVFDRFALQVVSRAVFGAPPTVGEALGAWRDILWPGLVSGLTLYRLHPARSAVLAVWQLEKQSGSQGKRRRDVLARRMTGSWTATGMCALFEAIIFLSLAVVGALLLPAGADTPADLADFFRGGGSEWQWDWLDSLCYVFAVSVVEPLYVAAGFSLYLNRRAILEGWDIELQLRRLDERLSAARAGLAAAVVLALAIGWLAVPQPQAVAAEQSAKEAINRSFEAPLAEGLRFERRVFHALFATEDQKEGMAAFIAKRPAKFKNK